MAASDIPSAHNGQHCLHHLPQSCTMMSTHGNFHDILKKELLLAFRELYNNNCFTALCLGLPWWAHTRSNIHPITSASDVVGTVFTTICLFDSKVTARSMGGFPWNLGNGAIWTKKELMTFRKSFRTCPWIGYVMIWDATKFPLILLLSLFILTFK